MPTKMPTKTPTVDTITKPTLPKGLYFDHRAGRPKPFFARWREPGGVKRSRAFSTMDDLTRFAAQWAKQRTGWGPALPVIHPVTVEKWKLFAEITDGADPIKVARFWAKYRSHHGGEIKLEAAIDRLMARRAERKLSTDRGSHVATHLQRLLEHLGNRTLGDITTDMLRQWLAGLKNPETGEPMAEYTIRNHLRDVKILFNLAEAERWCDTNPASPIHPPRRELEDVSILPIDAAQRLFAVNKNALCIGRLALEAFAGLRFSSAARARREHILFAEKGIVMPGAAHKSGRRHYIDGLPDNLWAWLRHASDSCWDITPRNYAKLKAEAFTRAAVENPGNVLRHSFCSYHIAIHKDAARTAVLLTHRSPAMLYQHYRGCASEADGKTYFEISP